MLKLKYDTPPSWAEQALAELPMLLSDHFFLEQKAALMARSIIAKWGERYPKLVGPLKAVEGEELRHAVQVDAVRAGLPRPEDTRRGNPYVRALRRRIAVGGAPLVDLLLTSALIEARSAERFRLLARTARGTPIGSLYEDFYAAEVGHYLLFVELAGDLFGRDHAEQRLEVLLEHEAEVVRSLPHLARMH